MLSHFAARKKPFHRVVSSLGCICAFLLTISMVFEACAGHPVPSSLNLPDRPLQDEYHNVLLFPEIAFKQPVFVATPPGESNRLFIVERAGRISVIPDLGQAHVKVFLDLRETTWSDYIETGLLGIAFHPDYQVNGRFFLARSVVETEGGVARHYNRLSSFQVSQEDPNRADPATELVVLSQIDPNIEHNAGDIRFGSDGYLYVTLGDRGPPLSTYQPHRQPIDRDFFGGILRIDVDQREESLAPNPHPASTTNYAIPPDNPFVGVTEFNGYPVNPDDVRTEFWAVGLRNPWRIAFDSETGDLYCGDVGASRREEINLIVKGGNYGWPYREGFLHAGFDPDPPGFSPRSPLMHYAHVYGQEGGKVVIGGLVYRGSAMPWLDGAYLFGDFFSGNIWALWHDGTVRTKWQWLTSHPGLCSFGIDPRDGEPLIVSFNDGGIYKLVHRAPEERILPPESLADTGLFTDLEVLAPVSGVFPYEVNTPLWSDGAAKKRWFGVLNPDAKIQFREKENWLFPEGTFWVKHFELELTNGVPESTRRLETRVLYQLSNSVYGVTYRWETPTNAILVPPEGLDETFMIDDEGSLRSQTWRYPSRADCLNCHTPVANFALGFNTYQLNRTNDALGVGTNQLSFLQDAGFLDDPGQNLEKMPFASPLADDSLPLAHRARSYLMANCVQCHQPFGFNAESALNYGTWDARLSTSFHQTDMLSPMRQYYPGNVGSHLIRPRLPDESILYLRMANLGTYHMPPLATTIPDEEALVVLRQWILRMPETPWEFRDVGSPTMEGSSEMIGDSVLLHSMSAGMGNESGDSLHFLARAESGPLSFTAHFEEFVRTDVDGEAGIHFRQSWESNSPGVFLGRDRGGKVLIRHRQAADEPSNLRTIFTSPAQWLKLEKEEGIIRAYISQDGGQWQIIEEIPLTWATPYLAGLAVTAMNPARFQSALFSGLSVVTPPSGTAEFVREDVFTRGDWTGLYGHAGFHLPAVAKQLAAEVSLDPGNGLTFTWTSNTSDPRALWHPDELHRVASTWYRSPDMDMSLDVDGPDPARVSMYFLDWDGAQRRQTVSLRTLSGQVLDQRTIEDFEEGIYLQWDIHGRVRVRVEQHGHGNAIMNGLFVDSPGTDQDVQLPEYELTENATDGSARIDFGEVQAGTVIRFTLDGTEPHWASPLYDGPFEIEPFSMARIRIFPPGPTSSEERFLAYYPRPELQLSRLSEAWRLEIRGTPGKMLELHTAGIPHSQNWISVLTNQFPNSGILTVDSPEEPSSYSEFWRGVIYNKPN